MVCLPCGGRGFPSQLKEGKYVRASPFLEPQCLNWLVEGGASA